MMSDYNKRMVLIIQEHVTTPVIGAHVSVFNGFLFMTSGLRQIFVCSTFWSMFQLVGWLFWV